MPTDDKIVRAAIHPGIGIARVGNSPDAYFIGPEVPDPVPAPPNFYKDDAGALKRQAARFRIYGYNQAGEVVKELTADDAAIQWIVHVANKKAAWYAFELAMDIPEAVPAPRRNANFQGEERRRLVIDPGPRAIQGKNQQGAEYRFDSGEFLGRKVYLGELRTDDRGNLLFLGGHGVSETPFPNNPPHTYANNDGWYDDIADGPVWAEVHINGEQIPVDPAWVVVGPPNFAPDILSIPTMYDLLYDAYQVYWLAPPEKLSFVDHIYPILWQLCNTQWVNYGFHVQFGWGAPQDFLRPAYLARLANNQPAYAEVRLQLFRNFRAPAAATESPDAWPQMYGDNMNLIPSADRQYQAVTPTQYKFLQQWVAGSFESDLARLGRRPPQAIEEVALAARPQTLDRAALTFCLGGPFHPGCEMTWPMRHISLYYAPFRIRVRAAADPEPDYGDQLTPAVTLGDNGPLYAQGPGDITRWMAVPWQTDTASCRAGYEADYDPYLPTFWPARVPNHVLSEANYQKVMNKRLPRRDRQLAFESRATFYRGLPGGHLDQIREMVTSFGTLGVVERREGPPNDPLFPPVIYVESQIGFDPDIPPDRNTVVGAVDKLKRRRRTQ